MGKNMGKKMRKSNKNRFMEEEQADEILMEEVEEYPKKGKKVKKGSMMREEIIEMEQPNKEDRKHQMKNDYFNGGK
jgi:hypothetical protein